MSLLLIWKIPAIALLSLVLDLYFFLLELFQICQRKKGRIGLTESLHKEGKLLFSFFA